jgi:RNA polymerase sigma factor (sigma-70 family)
MATSPENSQIALVHRLFLKHSGELRGFILAIIPVMETADDLLHEVFLLVTSKAADFQEGTNYLAWVKAIARRKVLEAARTRRGTVSLSPEVLESLYESAPETGLDESQITAIRECIEALPTRAKTIIDLRYRLECRPSEIARRIGWQVQSVSVELSRAREMLRRCLERKRILATG